MPLRWTRGPFGFVLTRHGLLAVAVVLILASCGGEAEPDPAATAAPSAATPTEAQAQVEVATPSPTNEPATPTATSAVVATPTMESQPLTPTPVPEPTPTVQRSSNGALGSIVFAGDRENNEPVDIADSFEAGITVVYAFFEYEELSPEDEVSSVWYHGAEELVTISSIVSDILSTDAMGAGKMHFWAELYDGYTPGLYRVDVSLNGELLQSGEFVVRDSTGAATINGITFSGMAGATGPTNDTPLDSVHVYPAAAPAAYAFFYYEGLTPQDSWGWRLVRDGFTVAEEPDIAGEDADAFGFYRLELPVPGGPGIYDLELSLNSLLIERSSFSVGDPTPADDRLLFGDDFDDPTSGWTSYEGTQHSLAYSNGAYVLEVLDGATTPAIGTHDGVFSDAVVEVDTYRLAGSENNAFGLVVRYQDENNFYGLLVSSDGYFATYQQEDGRIVPITDWEEAPRTLTPTDTNRLRVVMNGPELRLYANGHLLTVVQDVVWSEGQVGAIVAELGGQIEFDRWRVWELAEE